VRAQQVAEICKVYRVPSLENVQACLMLNVLEGGESWHERLVQRGSDD